MEGSQEEDPVKTTERVLELEVATTEPMAIHLAEGLASKELLCYLFANLFSSSYSLTLLG